RVGAQTPEGHLESDYLAFGATEHDARDALGKTPIGDVKALLDRLIDERRGSSTTRRWWDAMRDEGGDATEGRADRRSTASSSRAPAVCGAFAPTTARPSTRRCADGSRNRTPDAAATDRSAATPYARRPRCSGSPSATT